MSCAMSPMVWSLASPLKELQKKKTKKTEIYWTRCPLRFTSYSIIATTLFWCLMKDSQPRVLQSWGLPPNVVCGFVKCRPIALPYVLEKLTAYSMKFYLRMIRHWRRIFTAPAIIAMHLSLKARYKQKSLKKEKYNILKYILNSNLQIFYVLFRPIRHTDLGKNCLRN